MIKNFLKTAWRNIINNKAYSAINIVGLATGMAVALLIALWVYQEYSYDKFLPGYKQVYRVKLTAMRNGEKYTFDAASLPLADVMRKNMPEIKYVAETDWGGEYSLMVNEKKIASKGISVSPEFLKIFQYPLLKGNPDALLTDPYSIVLTESVAKALFGNEDALNKMVKFDNKHEMKVTGILKDVPGNSSISFSYLFPFSYSEKTIDWMRDARTQWVNNSFKLYVGLQLNADVTKLESKIKDLVYNNSEEMRPGKPEVSLQALKDWRLFSEYKNGKESGGFIDYVRMFSIIGILVLLIACINFMNLSTARSEKRAREVGVRKAIGSGRGQLIFQFIAESLMITFFAFLLSLIMLQLALPGFNGLTNSSIRIPWTDPVAWIIVLGFIIGTGLLAGSRPAFYLSSFRPVKVLKGTMKAGRTATLPRKILVVAQFTCSVALIISTIIIYRQIQHTKDRSVGFDINRLVMTEMSDDLNNNFSALRNDLMQSGLVENITTASSPITDIYAHTAVENWPGKTGADENIGIGMLGIRENYYKTLRKPLVEGRDFSNKWKTDSATVILNESAVKKMNLKEPLDQVIEWNGHQHARIIGVVKDVVMESPFTPIAPAIYFHGRGFAFSLYRLSSTTNIHEALAKLATVFEKYNPAYPYSYKFADDEYGKKFNLEVLVGKLAGLFAALAILISCLGLFGLAAYMAEQRKKEIGIRKVLGASVSRVWLLLSKEFLILVIIGCLIASPVALYFLKGWLDKYDYRIDIGPGVFIIAAIMAIAITILTISFQAIKAAVANPVKSLRTE